MIGPVDLVAKSAGFLSQKLRRIRMKKVKAFIAVMLGLLTTLHASAVGISPVKVEIEAAKKATAIELSNTDDSPHTYDIRVYKWRGTGPNGATTDASEATNIVTRPVITIPGKSKATVRLSIIQRSALPTEYYRIFVKDISPTPTGGDAKITVSMSLPLQVMNDRTAKGMLITGDADTLVNTGNAAVIVTGTKIGEAFTSNVRYVLPGESWKTKEKLENLVWVSGIQ